MFSTFLWSEADVVSDNKERGWERGILAGESQIPARAVRPSDPSGSEVFLTNESNRSLR